jgi:hypothetical protein
MPPDIVEADVLQGITKLRRKGLAGARLVIEIGADVQERDLTRSRAGSYTGCYAGRCTHTHLGPPGFLKRRDMITTCSYTDARKCNRIFPERPSGARRLPGSHDTHDVP